MVHRSLALLTTLIFLSPSLALADTSLSITKVVADVPGANAGHQYIEVTNTGSDPIDLGAKTIRLVDHSGKHLIKSYNNASTMLAPSESVAIAQNPETFLADNPKYSGAVLKSSFSLTETGSVSIAQTDGTMLATKSYASVPSAKPTAGKASSTSRGAKNKKAGSTRKAHTTYSSHNSYGKGMTAPADAANAGSAGASFGSNSVLPISPHVLAYIDALVGSVWFVVFLSLLAFSGFSLMVIEKGRKLAIL